MLVRRATTGISLALRAQALLILFLVMALLPSCAKPHKFYNHIGSIVVNQGEELTINLFYNGLGLALTDPNLVSLQGDGVDTMQVTWAKDCAPLETASPRYIQLRVRFSLPIGGRATILAVQIARIPPYPIGAIEIYGASVPRLLPTQATIVRAVGIDQPGSSDIFVYTDVAGGCQEVVSALPTLQEGIGVIVTDVSLQQDGSKLRFAFDFPKELWINKTCIIWRPAVTAICTDEETLIPGPFVHIFLYTK